MLRFLRVEFGKAIYDTLGPLLMNEEGDKCS